MNNKDAAKNEWEAETSDESIEFMSFKGTPRSIRRHNLIKGGMAALHFGVDSVEGKWIVSDDTIYFGLIASDIEGHGAKLLSRIRRLADKYDLFIRGHPPFM
jgi:hypothetical protein